jgi:hypothetical protein
MGGWIHYVTYFFRCDLPQLRPFNPPPAVSGNWQRETLLVAGVPFPSLEVFLVSWISPLTASHPSTDVAATPKRYATAPPFFVFPTAVSCHEGGSRMRKPYTLSDPFEGLIRNQRHMQPREPARCVTLTSSGPLSRGWGFVIPRQFFSPQPVT